MTPMDYVEPEEPGAQPAQDVSPAPLTPAALPSDSQVSSDATPTDSSDPAPRERRHWMPRSVKITLIIVVLFFVL